MIDIILPTDWDWTPCTLRVAPEVNFALGYSVVQHGYSIT